jgi:signal transduction histidine kinase
MDKAKTAFFTSISHELKTPVSPRPSSRSSAQPGSLCSLFVLVHFCVVDAVSARSSSSFSILSISLTFLKLVPLFGRRYSIKGPLTDLAESENDSGRKKQLSLALRNTARLARLIDSLMDFSRIEAGRMQGQQALVHRIINSLLTDVRLSFRFQRPLPPSRPWSPHVRPRLSLPRGYRERTYRNCSSLGINAS